MDKRTKKISLLGIGIALYVAFGFTMKIPLISHIQTDLGYIVYGTFLYLLGIPAVVIGVIGCLLESLIFSGWVPAGWMLGQFFIGVICGAVYKKVDNTVVHIIITIVAIFIGIAVIKTSVECVLYDIPLVVKFTKNFIAFIADVIPMIIGYFVAKKLPNKREIE